MLPATPQRTADSRLAAPAPITAPEIVWVVESGKPTCEEARITRGARALGGEALGGVHLVDAAAHRLDDAPAADVGAERDRGRRETTTQVGTWKSSSEIVPLATSASVITPIVFCASFVPCASASRPPEMTWPKRKPRVTGPGRSRPTIR